MQAVVAGWFGNNLLQIVLTGSALALLFYFKSIGGYRALKIEEQA